MDRLLINSKQTALAFSFFPIEQHTYIQNNCYFHSSFDEASLYSWLAIKHNLSITSSPEVSPSRVHFFFPIARTERRRRTSSRVLYIFCLPAHITHTHTCISRRVLSVILRPTSYATQKKRIHESVMHFIWRSQSTFPRRRRCLRACILGVKLARGASVCVYTARRASECRLLFYKS